MHTNLRIKRVNSQKLLYTHSLTTSIEDSINSKEISLSAFMDILRAFDNAAHEKVAKYHRVDGTMGVCRKSEGPP